MQPNYPLEAAHRGARPLDRVQSGVRAQINPKDLLPAARLHGVEGRALLTLHGHYNAFIAGSRKVHFLQRRRTAPHRRWRRPSLSYSALPHQSFRIPFSVSPL